MLNGISKLLDGNLLKVLCDMGHGDEIAIVDANYPAHTFGNTVLSYPGVSATELLDAIIKIFPIDHISRNQAMLMEVEPEDRKIEKNDPVIWQDFRDIIQKQYGNNIRYGLLSRQDYYDESKKAYAIIQTGEERLYGNIILVKGVVK